jgi:aryl carrier-like protein
MTGTIAATEATLCRILAEVLELDLVRPQDGFFEVGGDSVLAVAVVARAREAGLVLGVRDLFDHQTAGALAAVIGDLPATSGAGGDSADAATSERSPLLTFADDELGEFEDAEAGADASGKEAEWETLT